MSFDGILEARKWKQGDYGDAEPEETKIAKPNITFAAEICAPTLILVVPQRFVYYRALNHS